MRSSCLAWRVWLGMPDLEKLLAGIGLAGIGLAGTGLAEIRLATKTISAPGSGFAQRGNQFFGRPAPRWLAADGDHPVVRIRL